MICPQTPIWNWHIPFLCGKVQAAMERVFAGQPKDKDILINVSPGTTKSIIFSVMLQAWSWTRMPSCRHICGSHTESLVFDLSRKCRDVVKSPKYQQCFPEVQIRDDQDAKGYWINTSGGDRFCCTVGGKSPTGMHGHVLVIDDPLDPQKALSEAEVKTANEWMDGTLPSRKVDKTVSVIILVMQRLSPTDPSQNFLEKRKGKVEHYCFPAEISENIKPLSCYKYYKDGLFDPIRLSLSNLDEAKLNGLIAYSGQYMQDPLPLGGGMFRREWFNEKVVPYVPQDMPKVRYWDKAGSTDGNSFTCGILMGKGSDGKYYVLDEVRGQWMSTVRNAIMRETAFRDGTDVEILVEQEPGSGGKESAEITVKELAGFNVHIDLPAAKKEARADPFAAQCGAGNVFLKRAIWNHEYLEELCQFPSGKYKDRVDASAAAFNHLALHNNAWIFQAVAIIVSWPKCQLTLLLILQIRVWGTSPSMDTIIP